MIYFFVFTILFILEIAYFRLADHFNIIDKPNQRSLHSEVTIRGGGIIFPIAAYFYFFYSNYQYPYFFIGLLLISVISFLDDIFTISNRYRIIVQFLSIFLLLYELAIYSQVGLWIIFLLIVMVGIINAYNFMDGINGITGGYSLINMLTLLYVNYNYTGFIENEFIIFISLGLLVFNFFNFKKKAECFAGDIGSVSIAFIIIFLITKLIFQTNQYIYILFLSLYGIDTIFTIIVRIWQKENIFKAHNKHFFQLLVNKLRLTHLQVSLIYIIIQLMINLIVIQLEIINRNNIYAPFILLGILSSIYVYFRRRII